MDFNIESGVHGSSDHRNLNGILDGCFFVLLRKKSLGEIYLKMLLRKKYNLKLKSQQKMRSNTSLLGRILFWIASEMLEILTRIFNIIFNYNFFP